MIACLIFPIMLTSTPVDSSVLYRSIQHLTDSLHAEICVTFHDLEAGASFNFNERLLLHAASTMKVPVMIEVFRQAEAGTFSLGDSLSVKNEFKSIVDGSPYSMDIGEDSDESIYTQIGRRLTIRQLVEQMITVSSNLATNLLIELVDAKNVMSTLHSLGVKNMQVLRGVEDGKACERGLNNHTNAYDLMLTLKAIVEKKAASAAACDEMLEILKRQRFRENISAGLPEGTVVANKTGSITRIDHDAAIVFPPHRKPYILVVLTHNIEDHKVAANAIAEISKLVWQEYIEKRGRKVLEE
jgi:beta-lactamase class A